MGSVVDLRAPPCFCFCGVNALHKTVVYPQLKNNRNDACTHKTPNPNTPDSGLVTQVPCNISSTLPASRPARAVFAADLPA
jgi:hypothetical protein